MDANDILVQDLLRRIRQLEAKLLIPGPPGADGADGDGTWDTINYYTTGSTDDVAATVVQWPVGADTFQAVWITALAIGAPPDTWNVSSFGKSACWLRRAGDGHVVELVGTENQWARGGMGGVLCNVADDDNARIQVQGIAAGGSANWRLWVRKWTISRA